MSLFAPPMAGSAVPVGVLLDYGGNVAPDGWFLCIGTAVSRTTYADLFGVIGTNFGPGDGLTTFNIPDCRLKSTIGVQAGTINLGQSTGSLNHTHSTPAHQHAVDAHQHNVPAAVVGNHQHELPMGRLPNAHIGSPNSNLYIFGQGNSSTLFEWETSNFPQSPIIPGGGTSQAGNKSLTNTAFGGVGGGLSDAASPNTNISGASTSGANNPPVIGCNKIIKY